MDNKYEVLKKYFGYDAFRSGQETVIDAVLAGRDVFGIMLFLVLPKTRTYLLSVWTRCTASPSGDRIFAQAT